MKLQTRLFSVNLSEGFIVASGGNTIYGVYNSHHKAIVTAAPWTDKDFEIPEECKGYTIYNRICAHFSITGWTHQGDVAIRDLTKPLTKKEKLFEKA